MCFYNERQGLGRNIFLAYGRWHSLRRIRTKPRYSPSIPGFSSDAAQANVGIAVLVCFKVPK